MKSADAHSDSIKRSKVFPNSALSAAVENFVAVKSDGRNGPLGMVMLRTVRTCELAITLHTLSHVPGRIRPEIDSTLLFRGRDGVLPLDLWRDEHRVLRGKLTPIFYSRAGEVLHLPQLFEETIKKVTSAVCCVGCKHSHVGVPPVVGGLRP